MFLVEARCAVTLLSDHTFHLMDDKIRQKRSIQLHLKEKTITIDRNIIES